LDSFNKALAIYTERNNGDRNSLEVADCLFQIGDYYFSKTKKF
jgi:hypothetical protein